MRNTSIQILAAIAILLSACETNSEKQFLALQPIFSSEMVLQQQMDAPIWGESAANATITIKGSWGAEQSTTANDEGYWQLALATPEAGGPYDLSISTRDTSISLNNVLIGEVWLASGQSNMEMPLTGWPPRDPIANSAEEIANANFPQIRMFTLPNTFSTTEMSTFQGIWETCSPSTAGAFSATAYFFARRLHQELNIPVGIIHSSWGGTPAEAWTSQPSLKKLGDFDEAIEVMTDPAALQATKDWFSPLEKERVPNSTEAWADLDLGGAPQADFNTENWADLSLPGRFDEVDGGEINGSFWLSKTFNINPQDGDYFIEIGAIDDIDYTYINGVKVGHLFGYNLPRKYKLPKGLLKAGENTITIKAVDTGGPGQVAEPLQITAPSGQTTSLSGTWKAQPQAEIYKGQFHIYNPTDLDISQRPKVFAVNQNMPTVLYNAMLKPLVPYGIKGSIWYQGESNVGRAAQYEQLFPLMISDWREKWGYDFPFYFVQIAPFNYTGNADPTTHQSQKLREAQRKTLTALPKTGMTVTMDVGNYTNIHPANKQDVGARLAGLALQSDYQKLMEASGPLYKGHAASGAELMVAFSHSGNGLVLKETGTDSGFEVAGADGVFYKASAEIRGNNLFVKSARVKQPKEVRYGWSDYGAQSLFNKEGLPASSFSSE